MKFVENTKAVETAGNVWSHADSEAARQEGWDIFLIDGNKAKPDIQKVDELDMLDNDEIAVSIVEEFAAKGSELHMKALSLHNSWTPGKIAATGA